MLRVGRLDLGSISQAGYHIKPIATSADPGPADFPASRAQSRVPGQTDTPARDGPCAAP